MSTWTKIRDAIEGFLSGNVWTFVKPFIQALESEEGSILIAAAEGAVAVGLAVPEGGGAAMAAALTFFETEVAAKTVPFIESQARALIEVALQKVKASIPGA